MSVVFGNLRAQYDSMRAEIDTAVKRVLESGWYILGDEVKSFEREFADHTGVPHCIAVGNGTDAIEIALRALGIGAGDEVLTVSHTATFTALGIAATGARPVFVDVDERSFTMDPQEVRKALTPKTRAVLPVHLYGMPADLDALRDAIGSDIPIIEDAAQAHGAELKGRRVGSMGTLGCFSFYPSKNLGALGDGGAITTADQALATRAQQIRNGGQADRYHHELCGVNSRLDELQAAILRAKLPHLNAMNERRRTIAARYRAGLGGLRDLVLPPEDHAGMTCVYHLFVVRSPQRDLLHQRLKERGVATQMHYPIPAHLQKPFVTTDTVRLPVTERLSSEILSLPIYPELTDEHVDEVIDAVLDACRAG